MRTRMLLLAAALALVACDEQPTAPVAGQVSSAAVSTFPPGPTVTASKPRFTITTVVSPASPFGGAGNGLYPTIGTLNATCPAGSQVIAGGYEITSGYTNDMRVNASKPNAANGWGVTFENVGIMTATAFARTTAVCIQ